MSDQPEIIRAKGKRGGQPNNRNAFKHGYRGLCASEPLVREGYARNLGLVSPNKLPEKELRNLLGEAAMLKDYMYFLYNCNIVSHDSSILAETLRGLSLASMALARLLQVHCQVRVHSSSNSDLSSLLAEMDSAVARSNRIATSISGPDEDDLDD